MKANTDGDITRLLASWRAGNRGALDRLSKLIQGELRRIARRHLGRERKDHPMQLSSLVQEAFIRLLHGDNADRAADRRNRARFLPPLPP